VTVASRADLRTKFGVILATAGVHEALRFLNSRTPHRFTGLYVIDGDMLRSVDLVDVYTPDVRKGEDSAADETFCGLVRNDDAPFATEDAREHERLRNHPARERVISYCGVLLRDKSGQPFGTLCHFDVMPCEIPHEELPLMEQAAQALFEALR